MCTEKRETRTNFTTSKVVRILQWNSIIDKCRKTSMVMCFALLMKEFQSCVMSTCGFLVILELVKAPHRSLQCALFFSLSEKKKLSIIIQLHSTCGLLITSRLIFVMWMGLGLITAAASTIWLPFQYHCYVSRRQETISILKNQLKTLKFCQN